jgi:hypothetical protein
MKTLFLVFLASMALLHGGEPQQAAIVRPTPKIRVSTGRGDFEATELWLLDKKTSREELILRGKDDLNGG